MIFNAVINSRVQDGSAQGAALASGLSAAALTMAIWSACGIALVVLMGRHRQRARAVDVAAAAAAAAHTIPTRFAEPSAEVR
jgi:hypothetical protein